MATRARSREALHLELIYRHHPLFAGAEPRFWSDHLDHGPALEGGDILVLGNRSVLVGVGQRSRPVDRDAFTVFASLLDRLDAYTLTPGPAGLRARHVPDLFRAIARARATAGATDPRRRRLAHGSA